MFSFGVVIKASKGVIDTYGHTHTHTRRHFWGEFIVSRNATYTSNLDPLFERAWTPLGALAGAWF